MKSNRMTKLAISFWIVLSLFASSVSACNCAHDSASQSENHCQPNQPRHSHESENESHLHSHESSAKNQQTNRTENFSDALSLADCCCFQSAPRVFAKSETVKIEKQAAEVLTGARIVLQLTAPIIAVKTLNSVAPVYLSDFFYNFKSPRAPPRS